MENLSKILDAAFKLAIIAIIVIMFKTCPSKQNHQVAISNLRYLSLLSSQRFGSGYLEQYKAALPTDVVFKDFTDLKIFSFGKFDGCISIGAFGVVFVLPASVR